MDDQAEVCNKFLSRLGLNRKAASREEETFFDSSMEGSVLHELSLKIKAKHELKPDSHAWIIVKSIHNLVPSYITSFEQLQTWFDYSYVVIFLVDEGKVIDENFQVNHLNEEMGKVLLEKMHESQLLDRVKHLEKECPMYLLLYLLK